jgi:hypothetical protein
LLDPESLNHLPSSGEGKKRKLVTNCNKLETINKLEQIDAPVSGEVIHGKLQDTFMPM